MTAEPTESPPSDRSESTAFTIEQVIATPVPQLRVELPGWLAAHALPAHADDAAARVRAAMDGHSDSEIATAVAHYAEVAAEYHLYPADPVARDISLAFVRGMALEPSATGIDNLRTALAAGPCLLVCNHLSYSDSQFTDLLLSGAGAEDLSRRLVYVAGPKVYQNPARRMAAVGLSTLPTVQSSRLGSAQLSAREIARIALGTVAQAGELMQQGSAVMLYAEGSRSRTGRLGSFLRAGARYANAAQRIVPLALSGTNRSFPVGRPTMEPAPIRLAIAPAVEVGSDRQAALAEAWHAIAGLLPTDYRPEPDQPPLV